MLSGILFQTLYNQKVKLKEKKMKHNQRPLCDITKIVTDRYDRKKVRYKVRLRKNIIPNTSVKINSIKKQRQKT